MSFIIGLLTVVLVLDCVVLVFLVLIQLPKKDAGAGLAFGGAASDALFGAGSGNVLTKVTKYSAGVFFVLALLLSVLQTQLTNRGTSAFSRKLAETDAVPGAMLPPPTTAPAAQTPAVSNAVLSSAPQPEQAPATNTPAAPK